MVRILFEQFGRLGTVSGLLRYLVREGIHIPVRPHYGAERGQLVWRFWSNQDRLTANRASATTAGAPRRGPALLGGLLVCGRCGYRLLVNYNDHGRSLRYCCSRGLTSYGEMECQTLSGQ